MSVDLEPTELGFRRPFNREVIQTLHLRNPNSDPVAFKVKTTAPKHYCVRPNSGRIEPGKHVEVQVLLQAMKQDPAPDHKCRDKFLVQSVAVTPDKEFSNVTSIWQEVEATAKSSIQERKIRVTFLPPDPSVAPQNAETNGIAPPDEDPPAYTTPAAKLDTPSAPNRSAPAKSDSISQPLFEHEKPKRENTPPPTESTKQSTKESIKPEITVAAPVSNDDLRSQLAEARAQIQRLKAQLANPDLRERKTAGGSSAQASATSPEQQLQEHPQSEIGVPLQVVAGLCFLSFLLAYIFF